MAGPHRLPNDRRRHQVPRANAGEPPRHRYPRRHTAPRPDASGSSLTSRRTLARGRDPEVDHRGERATSRRIRAPPRPSQWRRRSRRASQGQPRRPRWPPRSRYRYRGLSVPARRTRCPLCRQARPRAHHRSRALPGWPPAGGAGRRWRSARQSTRRRDPGEPGSSPPSDRGHARPRRGTPGSWRQTTSASYYVGGTTLHPRAVAHQSANASGRGESKTTDQSVVATI